MLAYCPDTRAVIVEWGSELKCIRESSSARTDATKLAMLSQMAAGVQVAALLTLLRLVDLVVDRTFIQ